MVKQERPTMLVKSVIAAVAIAVSTFIGSTIFTKALAGEDSFKLSLMKGACALTAELYQTKEWHCSIGSQYQKTVADWKSSMPNGIRIHVPGGGADNMPENLQLDMGLYSMYTLADRARWIGSAFFQPENIDLADVRTVFLPHVEMKNAAVLQVIYQAFSDANYAPKLMVRKIGDEAFLGVYANLPMGEFLKDDTIKALLMSDYEVGISLPKAVKQDALRSGIFDTPDGLKVSDFSYFNIVNWGDGLKSVAVEFSQ